MILAADFWAVVGGVAAVLAVLIAIAVYLLQARRDRRAVTCHVGDRSLVSVGREARDKVRITYDGVEVTGVRLIEVVLRNSGRAPLRKEDFERPIAIRIPEGVTLLPSTLAAVGEPEEIRPVAVLDGIGVSVEPTLLNPGDRISVGILASGFSRSAHLIDVDVRIAGVKDVSVEDNSRSSPPPRAYVLRRASTALLVATTLTAAVGGLVANLATQRQRRSHTAIAVASGRPICGDVLARSTRELVVAVRPAGEVRRIALDDVRRVRLHGC
jgi:hypothetical protein